MGVHAYDINPLICSAAGHECFLSPVRYSHSQIPGVQVFKIIRSRYTAASTVV